MNPSPIPSEVPQRSWRAVARRRWPAIAGGLVVLLLSAWALSRRDQLAEGAHGEAPGEQESVDTIVSLDSTSLRLAAIELVVAGGPQSLGLVANGTITLDANHASVVASRAEGRVLSVRADLGQPVRSGSVLALIESSEVGATRGELERARASLEVARQNYEREKGLFEQQVSSQKEMLEAQAVYRAAQADYKAAAAKIRALGASPTASEDASGVYALVSPVAGTIVERNAMPGQIAGPETNLFTVADLRRVWITVNVYESDITRVRLGAPALVTTRAMPDEIFRGRVTFAGGVVDTTTRTLNVRVEVENRAGRLRPGMYAQIQVEAPNGTHGVSQVDGPVLVPELAVQDLNGKTVVFVPDGPPGRFIARQVSVGSRMGAGFIAIASGLRRGDKVVAMGAFKLKAELMKASFGEKE